MEEYQKLTLDKLLKFANNIILRNLSVECLVVGSTTKTMVSQALKLIKRILHHLNPQKLLSVAVQANSYAQEILDILSTRVLPPPTRAMIPPEVTITLNKGIHYGLSLPTSLPEETNSVIVLYFQVIIL